MATRRTILTSSRIKAGFALSTVVSTVLLLLLFVATAPLLLVSAKNTLSANDLSKYWIDARDVLEDLDQYQALWIKIHGCVWSECAVDNNDDDGENRDGDEQWYLARTQDFCANVAFSLYGIPKNHVSVMSCSRGNFINSFFTYGGADTLLESLGKSPNLYYDGSYVNGYYNSNYENGYNVSNADCVVDEDSYMSSTMGCSIGGKFVMAEFEGDYCHGTDFYDIIDPLHKYNRQMGRLGCHRIWGRNFGSSAMASQLFKNSWSCDLNLYPNGCPDPYGKKASYDYALRAVAHGQSASWAVANMKLKLPLRILSWLMIVSGIFFLIFGYHVQNRDRMKANGGGLRGFFSSPQRRHSRLSQEIGQKETGGQIGGTRQTGREEEEEKEEKVQGQGRQEKKQRPALFVASQE